FIICCFFFSSRRRHTRLQGDWSSDVCSSDLQSAEETGLLRRRRLARVRWRHAAERARAAPAGDDVAAQQDVSSASARRRSGNRRDRKSTRLNSSHLVISYAVFCLKKKKKLKI